MSHLESGNKFDFWADTLPPTLTIVRMFDKCVLILWVISLAVCISYVYLYRGVDIYNVMKYISLPFVAVGGICFIYLRAIRGTLIILACCGVLYYLQFPVEAVLLVLYIFVGSLGVAALVDAIQRVLFFGVLKRLRYLNVNKKMNLSGRIVGFFFNIPPDLDTRYMEVTTDSRAAHFPFKDMGGSIGLSLLVAMFFWIYLSMNPNLISNPDYSVSTASMFIFTIMLYVPLIVLPFSIFKSVNARIVTGFRDFSIYGGIFATIKRMAVPVMGALLIVLAAMNKQDPFVVLGYIIISAIMALVIVCVTSMIYYYYLEATAVSDISRKWPMFIPVNLFYNMEGNENNVDKYPKVPSRNPADMAMGLNETLEYKKFQ